MRENPHTHTNVPHTWVKEVTPEVSVELGMQEHTVSQGIYFLFDHALNTVKEFNKQEPQTRIIWHATKWQGVKDIGLKVKKEESAVSSHTLTSKSKPHCFGNLVSRAKSHVVLLKSIRYARIWRYILKTHFFRQNIENCYQERAT